MMLRRSPCVGICSTTYGDLVCRGCKRFAHEIVQWNGFEDAQQQAVIARLQGLRAGAVRSLIEVLDAAAVRAAARRCGIADPDCGDPYDLAEAVLQRASGASCATRVRALGLCGRAATAAAGETDPAAVLEHIDREFYRRSLAHYERNFRIPAQ